MLNALCSPFFSLPSLVQVLFKCSLSSHDTGASYADTDLSSAGSASSSPPESSSPCSPPTRSEWTGGWGVDIDQLALARRRRRELPLRHVTFVDNGLGTNMHYSQEEIRARQQTASEKRREWTPHDAPPAHAPSDSASRSLNPGLENLVSLLLLSATRVETCNIWRNNLTDRHAVAIVSDLLLHHPSLRKLSLRFNGITEDGARQIEHILQHHRGARNATATGAAGGAKFEELDLASETASSHTVAGRKGVVPRVQLRKTPVTLTSYLLGCAACVLSLL